MKNLPAVAEFKPATPGLTAANVVSKRKTKTDFNNDFITCI